MVVGTVRGDISIMESGDQDGDRYDQDGEFDGVLHIGICMR